jgi:glucose-1-phosphate cytidylyltransferase|tara:strand:+ start:1748 stop:2515 length:768 start_codon:yes stop_codon:yes gene_type:complete
VKAVILAGGLGTRISEESHLKPKPMIEIGGLPILWHIMKIYAQHGINDFVICCGYKGYIIKEYFANYFLHMSDVTFDLATNAMEVHHQNAEPWRVTLVDTGEQTQTGGRINRVRDYLNGSFCLTYGDGVSDVDITALIAHHKAQKCSATVTAVQPDGRFGALEISDGKAINFMEKPEGDGQWINGGFFVCEMEIFDHLGADETVFEKEPLETIARSGQLSVWKHHGYWAAMDTLRDKNQLEKLWAENAAPWKIWK